MSKETPNSVSLVMVLDAPAAEVWKAWTIPQYMGWYGSDPAGTVLAAHSDVRQGGHYEVTFQNSDGSEYTCKGTYLAVEPTRLLEFTWTWAGREDHIERARVALAENEGSTTMLFEHFDIDPQTSHSYAEGWRTCFGKLKKQLRNDNTGSIQKNW